MLVTIIAILCHATDVPTASVPTESCIAVTVTDQAKGCGIEALQSLPHWMEEQGYLARGYRLAKWQCQIGKRAVAA